MNFTLFPKNEEWGTGDESLDLRLSHALKKATMNMSLESIGEFYFFGSALRPRVHNPSLPHTIELVTKALLFYLSPDDYNDVLLKKIKGRYNHKEKCEILWDQSPFIVNKLKECQHYRYNQQIDFYLLPQKLLEHNPYVSHPLKKAPYDLQLKILFKDFKTYLNGDECTKDYDSDPFFQWLKKRERIHCIKNLADIWFDNFQIHSIVQIIA